MEMAIPMQMMFGRLHPSDKRMPSLRIGCSGPIQMAMAMVTIPSVAFEMIAHKIPVHRQLMCRVAPMAMGTDIPIHMGPFVANWL